MRYYIFPMVLTMGFFIFLLVTGRAFFALTRIRMKGIACWLLSPAMGLAVLGLLAGWLNQAGLPVRSFGTALVAALAFASVLILWWRKCPLPWAKLTIGAAIAVPWLATAGYPLIRYGNDWLSFVNDDFANYCVGATRLLNHGFFELPTEAQLRGQDHPAIYWLMHVAASIRPVTDFVLAVASAVSRMPPREVFMPVILVFALLQASALGGILALSHRFKKATAVAMLTLLLSPMFILGVYYQLIAQVGGLSLLLLTLALLVRSDPNLLWRKTLPAILPCAVAGAALLWFYPECAPFALIPAGMIQLFFLIRKPALRTRFFHWVSMVSILVVGLLHINAPLIFIFLSQQIGISAATSTNSIFPYFLSMDGWVRTVGWTTFFGKVPPYLWTAAASLIVVSLMMLLRKCRIMLSLACVALVMLLMAASLAGKQNGFGLFKMAMFAQPVFAAGLAILWHSIKPKILRATLVLCWLIPTLPVSWNYQFFSLGQPGGPCESPFATRLGFPGIFKFKEPCKLINMSAGQEKLAVISLPRKTFNPIPLAFTSMYWGTQRGSAFFSKQQTQITKIVPFNFVKAPDGIDLFYCDPPPGNSDVGSRFLVEPHSIMRPFNRFYDQAKMRDWFSISKINTWANQNRLAWLPSAYVDEVNTQGVIHLQHYQGIKIEQDVTDPSRTFWGAGRHLLFEVVNDTPEIYLRVSFSRTYCGSGRVLLPERAFARGVNQQSLHFTGSGAANVIVGPLKPSRMKERALVALDLGMPEQQFFEGDSRRFCGWIRDVSALSPERYQQLTRPSSLRDFPSDLLNNPSLEYSGIYEDGMIDQKSWVGLSTMPNEKSSGLLVEGEIPLLPGLESGNSVSVFMNGVLLREMDVPSGRFTALVSLPTERTDWARFELKWGKTSRLSRGDDRPVAAKLLNIGVIPIR